MNKYYFIVLFGLNLINYSARADSIANFDIDKLPSEIKTLNLKLVGNAKLSILFWDIYQSALYTPSGKYASEVMSDEIVFRIQYLRDITAKSLIERTIEQWRYLKIVEGQYEQFLPKLNLLWPDISSGDTLTLHLNKNRSLFYFNNTFIGSIDDPTFGSLFLSIWLSPNTSQKDLRAELLGGG